MRHTAVLALVSIAALGCAGSSSSTNTGTAATPAPATTSSAPAGANPCSGADCQVLIEIPEDISTQFTRQNANFKVYQGCPRSLGISNADGLRGIQSVVASRTPIIPLPGTFAGRFATVGVFFGATPARYVVVDFGASKAAKANFGYRWEGNAMVDDKTIVNTNTSYMARTCR